MYYFDRKIQSIILYVDKIKSRFYKGGRRTSSSPHGTWYMNWGSLCSLARLFLSFIHCALATMASLYGGVRPFLPILMEHSYGPPLCPCSRFLVSCRSASSICGFLWIPSSWMKAFILGNGMLLALRLLNACWWLHFPLCPIHFVEGASMPWLTGHLPRLRALITGQG